jgi:hypothetical protein
MCASVRRVQRRAEQVGQAGGECVVQGAAEFTPDAQLGTRLVRMDGRVLRAFPETAVGLTTK